MPPVFVLNVDDYEAARYAKTRLLENAGFRVQEACDGRQALCMIATMRPEVILLDVRLPDIDGREVCRRIRANPATSGAFIVQISAAYVAKDDIASGYASGADAYVTAPYAPEELVRLLRSSVH